MASPKTQPAIDQSAMFERPGLLGWLLFRFCFSLRLFRDEDVETLRGLASQGRLVYVASHRHVYNALYFNLAFRRFGLPLARLVTSIFTLIFRPVGVMLRYLFGARELDPARARAVRHLSAGEAVMLFLRKGARPGLPGKVAEADEVLQAGIDAQRAGGKPVILVPLHLFWGTSPLRLGAPGAGRIRRLLGGPEDPGAFRSFVQLFRYFRHQWPRLGEPLYLDRFLADNPELDDSALVRRLRFELTNRTETVRRVVQGPRRKGSRRIRDEVLRGRRLRGAISALAEQQQESPQRIEKVARRYLDEIAADPGPWTLNFVRWFLGKFVWYRVYDGLEVDEEGMSLIRAAAAKGPLLFLPSHRSHVDYLLLSWLVAHYGVAPPCIAAGANLSFWPIGAIFRRSGAFFIRRSFWHNRLYTDCLAEYLRKLLAEGYNLEFFIEGTRSRSGKVLMPRMGLLKWVADAALEGRARNVQVVPIAIGYEKVIEERAITREASGGSKKQENVGEVFKAGRVLASRFGRLNFQVHPPYDLRQALAEHGATREANEEQRTAAVNQLAFRVVREIAMLTAATPTALVSTALLVTGRRTVDRPTVNGICQWLLGRLRRNGARIARALVAPPAEGGGELEGAELLRVREDAIEKALLRLARDRAVQISGARNAPAYKLPEERRLSLAYYRNGLINHLTAESIVARALLTAEQPAQPWTDRSLVRGRAYTLSRVFKHEFVFQVGRSFDELFDETLERLSGWGVVCEGAGLQVVESGRGALELLALLLQDFVEAYLQAATALEVLLKGPVGRKSLLRRMGDVADRGFYRGEIQRREACSKTFHHNAVAAFLDLGVIHETVGSKRQGPPLALVQGYDTAEGLGELVRQLAAVRIPTRLTDHAGLPVAPAEVPR
ncbi:MAG: 1-acyl-sn-glycerol-3-phosphate acyltransferase [bacterium]